MQTGGYLSSSDSEMSDNKVWRCCAHSACQTFCHSQRKSPKITVSLLPGSFEGSTPEAALLTFHNDVRKHQKTPPTTALGVCSWGKKDARVSWYSQRVF